MDRNDIINPLIDINYKLRILVIIARNLMIAFGASYYTHIVSLHPIVKVVLTFRLTTIFTRHMAKWCGSTEVSLMGPGTSN
jgi:hypothetical protein